jgi:penicillin-binding protein 2
MRDRILSLTVSVMFTLACVGLFYTQIIKYPYYSRCAKNNSIRIIPIDGPRGTIYDRNGTALASNRLSFDIAIVYQELGDRAELARVLKGILGMSGRDITNALDKARVRPYVPVVIAEDVDKEKAIAIDELSSTISGLVVETGSIRDYRYGAMASHLLGYLGEVTEEELGDTGKYGYRMRDLVGRVGLEKYYNNYLKGVDGGTQVMVDSKGRQVKVLGVKEPESGKDLILTVDLNLQAVCDKVLEGHKGAVIAMNPRSGQILALASHPAFDPNIFVRPNMSDERVALLTDLSGKPLTDRAISGLYPPGSVFKIVTAASALETKKISTNTRFNCPGFYRLGNARFDCWKDTGHGLQDVRSGLMNSCNVFFYNTGRVSGADAIEKYARAFGFGELTGIDLPDEVKGIVPGRSWKTSFTRNPWYEGDTVNYSIGQGYLMVTPIQVLDMMACVANNGSYVRPYIVKSIGSSELPSTRPRKIGLKESTLRSIREGLFEVVNSESGTGKRARVKGVNVAGKTGTAENPLGRTHAWFAGFAPYEDPKICVVVFLEHGGKGGIEPPEMARAILEEARDRGYI